MSILFMPIGFSFCQQKYVVHQSESNTDKYIVPETENDITIDISITPLLQLFGCLDFFFSSLSCSACHILNYYHHIYIIITLTKKLENQTPSSLHDSHKKILSVLFLSFLFWGKFDSLNVRSTFKVGDSVDLTFYERPKTFPNQIIFQKRFLPMHHEKRFPTFCFIRWADR